MNVKKVLAASVLWIVFFYVFNEYPEFFLVNSAERFFLVNVIKWVLGVVTILSVALIIVGLIGCWNNYKANKEKKQKLEEIFICGVIIFITAMINYVMIVIVCC